MDGSVTPRAEMAGQFARWANSHREIWKSHPVKGDIGLVFAPESELFNYVQQGDTNFYAQSLRGAYQAFFDSNIQADFVALDDLAEYKIVYLSYPLMLSKETVAKLRAFVEQGGTLISEGLPAYFGDHGRAGETQPNYGLDELFGARERYVEFTPDLLEKLVLTVNGYRINGRYFLQEYEPAGGRTVGHYLNGHAAAIESQRGRGRTLLVGTFPGAGYYLHHSAESKAFFAELLKLANVQPQIQTDNPTIQSRLHAGQGGNYLWVTNPARSAATTTVSIGDGGPRFQSATEIWANRQLSVSGQRITVTLPPRDGAVIALR
jgi:beta-galactosidase